jgi:hypothetical protein
MSIKIRLVCNFMVLINQKTLMVRRIQVGRNEMDPPPVRSGFDGLCTCGLRVMQMDLSGAGRVV